MPGTDLRPALLPIRDQGLRQTCLAFASSAAHEQLRAEPGRSQEALSVEALYLSALVQSGAPPNAGLTFESIRSALETDGQPREAEWPYGSAAPVVRDPEVFNCASEFVDPKDIDRLTLTLDSGRLVVAGFVLTQDFLDSTSWRLPEVFQPPLKGLHAMALVGYEALPEGQVDAFILRNSWGEAWGDKGYGCMPLSYFADSCLQCLVLIPH